MRVDGTRYTVLHLCVQLGKSVPIIDTSFLDIPNSSLLNDVPHQKPLNRLVLGAALAAVGAANELHVTTPVLVPSSISSLEGHLDDRLALPV